MLRIGCIVLSIWSGIQFIASVMSLTASFIGKYAPMMKMVFTDDEIASIDTKILGVTKALAINHNTGAAVFSLFSLIITWFALNNGQKWSFWTLLFLGLFSHVNWFLSDALIGNRSLVVNIILLVVFVIGISLSGIGLFNK